MTVGPVGLERPLWERPTARQHEAPEGLKSKCSKFKSLCCDRPRGGVCYLDAPQAAELLDRGEVGSAQVLPQPIWVADVVVQVVGDVAETWRRTAAGSSRNPTCPAPNTHSKGF